MYKVFGVSKAKRNRSKTSKLSYDYTKEQLRLQKEVMLHEMQEDRLKARIRELVKDGEKSQALHLVKNLQQQERKKRATHKVMFTMGEMQSKQDQANNDLALCQLMKKTTRSMKQVPSDPKKINRMVRNYTKESFKVAVTSDTLHDMIDDSLLYENDSDLEEDEAAVEYLNQLTTVRDDDTNTRCELHMAEDTKKTDNDYKIDDYEIERRLSMLKMP